MDDLVEFKSPIQTAIFINVKWVKVNGFIYQRTDKWIKRNLVDTSNFKTRKEKIN